MNVAVLGCGPAGLMAADAAWELGHDVDIFSLKKKSPIAGAQFVHAKTGWYCSPTHDLEVNVIKVGSAEGYAHNVYNNIHAKTSWKKFTNNSVLYGWDLKQSYDRLWDRYESHIVSEAVTKERLLELLKMYTKVISSIPLGVICHNKTHTFTRQTVLILHGPAREQDVSAGDIMYYNGLPDRLGVVPGEQFTGASWYRFSQLAGYQAWEYGAHKMPKELLEGSKQSHQEVSTVGKAVSTNCDCWSDVIRVGRYGCWDKNILTHHVREQVLNALQ